MTKATILGVPYSPMLISYSPFTNHLHPLLGHQALQVIGLTRPLAKAAGKVDARDIIWSGSQGSQGRTKLNHRALQTSGETLSAIPLDTLSATWDISGIGLSKSGSNKLDIC